MMVEVWVRLFMYTMHCFKKPEPLACMGKERFMFRIIVSMEPNSLKQKLKSFWNHKYQKILSESKLIDFLADALTKGKVIGFFHGRAEWGPRALGARSILADPRR